MQAEPSGGRSHAWHSYQVLHRKSVQALAEDVDSVCGKAFARADKRAVDEVSARDQG